MSDMQMDVPFSDYLALYYDMSTISASVLQDGGRFAPMSNGVLGGDAVAIVSECKYHPSVVRKFRDHRHDQTILLELRLSTFFTKSYRILFSIIGVL